MRHLLNGSFEPLWRKNARDDADNFKDELFKSPSRRAFLGGAGAALLLEYTAMRRAVAFPFPHGAGGTPASVTGITNARTGLTYQFIPDALMATVSGDTILMPAGLRYQYLGTTMYYAHYKNTNPRSTYGQRNIYLGHTSPFQSSSSGDYGTLQAVGTDNNGRALIAPTWGVLAADFHIGDTEMFLDPSTPVTNFYTTGYVLYCLPSENNSDFKFSQFTYSAINIGNNSLTGCAGNTTGTLPAGSIITTFVGDEGKALFIATGQNPGWTFTNLELAYALYVGGICSSVQQQDCGPLAPYVGSMTFNNCYIHDCKQGPGLGHTGITGLGGGPASIFAHFFDTEFANMGDYTDQVHNIYIGGIGELVMDNCYSHHTLGAWLVKSRAALNILTYNQIRGERTDSNNIWVGRAEGSGCDISNGGLTYFIGNIHQQSLNAANQAIDYGAEDFGPFSQQGGGPNPLQELYVVNDTFVGPANGVGLSGAGVAPIKPNYPTVMFPAMPIMGETAGGSLAARSYWAAATNAGATSGQTISSWLSTFTGGGAPVSAILPVGSSQLLTVQAPAQYTGTNGWNCYAAYGDPPFYASSWNNNGTPNNVLPYWDVGLTQPVYTTTTGGTVVSCTGTLTNGSNIITGVSGISGVASMAQINGMTVYVGGVNQVMSVYQFDATAGTLSCVNAYGGTTATGTIQFGYLLYCGVTYQTALGDSLNAALWFGSDLDPGSNPRAALYTNTGWNDGSYTGQATPLSLAFEVQLDPGQKLVLNAPPSGPSWAPSGVNFWARMSSYFGPVAVGEGAAYSAGMTKLNSSPVGYGTSFTTGASVIINGENTQAQCNLMQQNPSTLTAGSTFTEPTSGLVNHNPSTAKLQWFRRGQINYNGNTMECWYTVVPGGGLSGYSDAIRFGYQPFAAPPFNCMGSISIWRGCTAAVFDAKFPRPVSNIVNSTTVDTAGGNVALIAGIRGGGTSGTGFTQLSTGAYMNSAYKTSSGTLSGQVVTEIGGSGGDVMMVDALVGTSAPPTFVSSQTINSTTQTVEIDFMIASADAGDVIYIVIGTDNSAHALAIGQYGAPIGGDAVGVSPITVVQNCLSANYSSSAWAVDSNLVAMPGSTTTITTSLRSNIWNGSIFTAPLWATVFADSVQADYDYRLAVSSPALNAASNPGSVHSQDLIPHYQVSWHGLPADGTPIPTKATRTDIGPALTGSIGALT